MKIKTRRTCKYVVPAALFVVLFIGTFLFCMELSQRTTVLENGDVLPDSLRVQDCILQGPVSTGRPGEYVFRVQAGTVDIPISLAVADVTSSFRLLLGGTEIYRFDSNEGYQRVHLIPLDPAYFHSGILELTFTGFTPHTEDKFLLGVTARVENSVFTAHMVSMVTLGFYLTILFYSLTLYLRKPSEKYLLLLMALAVTALVSALSNSTLPLWQILIDQPVRFFRIVLCVVLCFRLSGVTFPSKWQWLLNASGVAALTLALFLLHTLGLRDLYNVLAYALAVPAAVAVVLGMGNRQNQGVLFLAGTAIRESLRIYFWAYSFGWLTAGPFTVYYYLPQFSSCIFTLACMIKINDFFAKKFSQADALAGDLSAANAELEQSNQTLDERVRQRTQELCTANETLLREQEKKDRMITNILHDLRSPIFNARGSADMLEPHNETQAHLLNVIKDRLDYLAHLTDELFLLSKLEEGEVTFDRFRVDLSELCQTVCGGYVLEAEKRGISLNTELPPTLTVIGDCYHLKKVLENLIFNALKFTSDGGSVRIGGRLDGDAAIVQVEDTGVGISPEHLPYIFERYYGTGKQSSGLGLYIVHEIVKAHGGAVLVESQPGRGSRFTVRFPQKSSE